MSIRHEAAIKTAEDNILAALKKASVDAGFLTERWESFGFSEEYWAGADVVITPEVPEIPDEPGFYPDPLFVVTPHSQILSGAFVLVLEEGNKFKDFGNKFELFEEMARAAIKIHAEKAKASAEEVVVSTLEMALRVFSRWTAKA